MANPKKDNDVAWLFNGLHKVKEREVTVTAAKTKHKKDQITLHVTGTHLSLSGPPTIPVNQHATYTAKLTDSANDGVARQAIKITSSPGLIVTPTQGIMKTNRQGILGLDVKAVTPGAHTFSIGALDGSEHAQTAINVIRSQTKVFDFIDRSIAEQTKIKHDETIAFKWINKKGKPVSKGVTFYTTRGHFASNKNKHVTVSTGADGKVKVTLTSNQAGKATVTAKAGHHQRSTQLHFIAIDPDSMVLKADPTTVDPGKKTTIKARVRDADGNPVPYIPVVFSQSGTNNGELLASVDTTNSAGKASVKFKAGSASNKPVTITATVYDGQQIISQQIKLTIGGEALYMSLGTNTSVSAEGTFYVVPYSVLVTDGAGNPAKISNVTVTIEPLKYYEGRKVARNRDKNLKDAEVWKYKKGDSHPAEDMDHDGVMDSGEDLNGNQKLDPAGVASVPGTIPVNDNGIATFNVTYLQSISGWVKVKLTVTGNVAGSENTASDKFVLYPGTPAAKPDTCKNSPFNTKNTDDKHSCPAPDSGSNSN